MVKVVAVAARTPAVLEVDGGLRRHTAQLRKKLLKARAHSMWNSAGFAAYKRTSQSENARAGLSPHLTPQMPIVAKGPWTAE